MIACIHQSRPSEISSSSAPLQRCQGRTPTSSPILAMDYQYLFTIGQEVGAQLCNITDGLLILFVYA